MISHLKYYPSIFLDYTGESHERDNHPNRNLNSESSRYDGRALDQSSATSFTGNERRLHRRAYVICAECDSWSEASDFIRLRLDRRC
jgi:hypothetical protein